ncbi:uncharacterized protein LOC119600970 [Lucilia sericata]|uniref:uncharacterized protein LOC119600970 n=1 Tax=Lucilia sericata TaxID=13632 RepID=UPI0018A80A7E|nr:uncharacterized protein LOC119600970 [Lucilia sericata]
MFYFKLTITLFLTIYLINPCFSKTDDEEINCSIQRKCSTKEDIVWASDEQQCYLFRNPCIFANEMCLRRAKNKEEYKVVTEDECKKHCHEMCTEEYTPVCGEYDNAYKTFFNECDFYRHSCQKNESYIFLHIGECDQAVAA